MRGTKAKRLRRESDISGEKPRTIPKHTPGKPRQLRREEKFHPVRRELAQQEADPAARRNHARRWNFIYSKAARKAAEKITRKKEPEWTQAGQEPS